MNLTRGLLLGIVVGLAGLIAAGMVFRSPVLPRKLGVTTKVEQRQQKEIVQLFIGHLAMGTPMPLTNPDEFLQPTRIEGEATALFQVPENFFGHAILSDPHVKLRSHAEVTMGQLSRHPDWIIQFDEGRHSSGYWIVKLSNPNGPTQSIWEFEFRRTGNQWQATLVSTTIGRG